MDVKDRHCCLDLAGDVAGIVADAGLVADPVGSFEGVVEGNCQCHQAGEYAACQHHLPW